MEAKEKVRAWLEENERIVLDLLKNLIEIPSVNPYFDEDGSLMQEGRVQDFLKEYLGNLGFRTEYTYPDALKLRPYKDKAGYHADHTFENRPNLFAEHRGTGGGKSILLTGHVDVVQSGSNWTKPPFTAVEEEGRIYGRGSVDMKGGIAAMISAAHAIIASGLRTKGDIRIGTVVDEEAGGMGTLALVAEGYRADGCVLTEPTDLRIAPLCRGILWGKIIIEGRAGHIELPQARWQEGGAVDAIDKMGYLIEHIEQLNRDWAKRKTHPLLALPCAIKIAQMHAGEYPTTYANKATITFNAQYLPKERDAHGLGSMVKDEIESYVQKVAKTDPWLRSHPPRIQWLIDADCGETDEYHPFVQSMRRSMSDSSEGVKRLEGTTSHTDMGWFTNVGIPTINFGPGNPMLAHQTDEYVEAKDVLQATKELAYAMIDWVGIE